MSQTHTIEGLVSGFVRQLTSRPDAVRSELDRLGGIRRRTLALVRDLDEAQAAFAPRSKAWSIAQNLDHIVLFEGLYRDAISKLIDLGKQRKPTKIVYTLKDIDVSISGLPNVVLSAMEIPMNLMNQFIPSFVRQTIVRFPVLAANSPKIAEPRAGLTLASLREQLTESARVTRDLLTPPLPAPASKMVISHPVLGINDIVDLLGMMCAHEERHQDQMRNILADSRLPKAA